MCCRSTTCMNADCVVVSCGGPSEHVYFESRERRLASAVSVSGSCRAEARRRRRRETHLAVATLQAFPWTALASARVHVRSRGYATSIGSSSRRQGVPSALLSSVAVSPRPALRVRSYPYSPRPRAALTLRVLLPCLCPSRLVSVSSRIRTRACQLVVHFLHPFRRRLRSFSSSVSVSSDLGPALLFRRSLPQLPCGLSYSISSVPSRPVPRRTLSQ